MTTTNPTEFLEVDCDYITATQVGEKSESSIDAFGRWVVETEVQKGEKARPWFFSRYRGLATPSAAFGRRHDGAIVRFSRHCAVDHWSQTTSMASNISRLDVQATVVGPLSPTTALRRHLQQLNRAKRGRGRRVNVDYFGGLNGLETLAVGSRTSDRYLRIYDKFVESGSEAYRGALRYEIEFKNEQAYQRAQFLDSSQAYQRYIMAWIFELATVRGLQLPRETWISSLADRELTGFRRRPLPQSDRLSKKVSWARFSVKPMVQEFVAAGRLGELLEALGLTEHVTLNQSELWTTWSN